MKGKYYKKDVREMGERLICICIYVYHVKRKNRTRKSHSFSLFYYKSRLFVEILVEVKVIRVVSEN